jgi:hypothetical protein
LATRLQSDEAGKDPKWADIDDDEDDWAPETVEWMDGTKSSVIPPEAQATPPPEEKIAPAVTDEEPEDSVKTGLTSMPKAQVAPSVKTILKPGTPVSNQPRTGGLVLKGAPEKPTLVAKTPTGPAKSPWASLPPVDKVPPVMINPPIQQTTSRFQRDPHGFDSLPPAPSPAKEIAADDFNRSWRDDRGTKELFNSQSGRYEPVTEARRGSRQEHGHRQPAVLQRPSQPGHSGPAEPSAAFQTSRSSGVEPSTWARRRASSNLSASSARRPSFGRLQDLPSRTELREGSSPVSAVSMESPQLPHASLDRTTSNSAPWTRASPVIQQVQPEAATTPGDVAQVNGEVQPTAEDNVAKQQRLMREKVERAKAQKQKEKEEEEREAAARAERLKLKLAELAVSAPSPELKDIRPKEAHTIAKSPQQKRPTPAASPPKPPVPTSAGEVAQYGMMKVHQPHPVKNIVAEAALMSKAQAESYSDNSSQPSRRPGSPMKPVGKGSQPQQQQQRNPAAKRLPDAPAESAAGPWKSPSDSYNWGNKAINAHSMPGGSNVWGPPTREKALGNGTFDTHNSLFSHPSYNNRQPVTTLPHGPLPPIAPPGQSKSAPRGSNLNSNFSTTHAQSQLQTSSSHVNNPLDLQLDSSPNAAPSNFTRLDNMATTTSTLVIEEAKRPKATKFNRIEQLAEPAVKNPALDSVFRKQELVDAKVHNAEHQKKVAGTGEASFVSRASEEFTMRKNKKKVATVHSTRNEDGERVDQVVEDHRSKDESAKAAKAAAPRSSRFFSSGLQLDDAATASSITDSPPPPEACSLLDDKTAQSIVVNLPAPKPVIKLPASSAQEIAKSAGNPPVAHSAGHPILDSSEMIAKINAIFGERKNTGAVNASSKAPLAQPARRMQTVVALPSNASAFGGITVSVNPFVIDSSSTIFSKTQADKELFEPPAFASKPTVRVPTQPHENHALGYAHDTHKQALPYGDVDAQTVSDISLNATGGITSASYRANKIVVNLKYGSQVKTVAWYPNSAPKKQNGSSSFGRRNFTPKPANGEPNTNPKKAFSQSPKPVRSGNTGNANRSSSSNWNNSKRAVPTASSQ